MSLRVGIWREKPDHNFTLKLISYGHSAGPLNISDDDNRVKLLYSVRDVPNPPNLLRKKHTGLNSRLRKEVLASKEGKARLEQILNTIEYKMMEMSEDYSRAPSPEPTAQDLYPAKDSPRELVVAIMCEEGRHRSVSFVEALSKSVPKRKDWVTKVEHRDLGVVESSEEEETSEEGSEEDGSVSPTLKRRDSSAAKRKERQRKKMLGMRIGSYVDAD